jgi:hypothetical protein
MAEPFKSTPASRVFGMGLPRRSNIPPATFFDTPIYEERRNLNPFVRQNAMAEQEIAMQEDALAAQQAQLARQQRVMEAEDAAISGLEQGEEIGNIFKNNPSLALSRNFNQFSNMAEMVRPSKAAQSMIPSLAMKLPIEERGVFNELVNQPEFANNPFAAYDEAQRRGSRSKQHGELVKAGVPLAKIDQTKDYSPIEFEDLVRQHKKPETGSDFTDKLVQQAWSGFDENYMPPEGIDDPVEIAIDMADKKNSIREQILAKYGKAVATQVAPAVGVPAPAITPTAPAITAPKESTDAVARSRLANLPADEIESAIKKEAEESAKGAEVIKAWQSAKEKLESAIRKALPDKDVGYGINPLEQFARQVLNPDSAKSDAQAPQLLMGAGSGNIRPSTVPNYQKTMAKIGLNPSQKAFAEPGANRKWLFELFGTQDVTNDEAIKAWAKDFAEKRGILDVPAAKELSPELRQKALSRVMETIETSQSVK